MKDEIMEFVKNKLQEIESKDEKTNNRINYAGRIYDEKEILNLLDASLEFWLTSGRYTYEFEEKLARYIGVNYCSIVNSGSSANLLAFMALTSSVLGERRIKKGDEVITVAAGFPTTVAPIIQFGAIPVFVDVDIPGYNINIKRMRESLTEKTKAIMIAHTLGNPFNVKEVKMFCEENNLWLIEDNCDSLGSEYNFNGKERKTGSFGDIATSSFYPPHHITMGEGGAVYTNNLELSRIVNSLRDWGRDCWCPSGKDNTCNCRFEKQFGELPVGYDHKYVYSHFGYNLKATDMQAAIGCAQLEKLSKFVVDRRKNWNTIKDRLECIKDKVILPVAEENSAPSWFGFIITIKDGVNVNRNEVVEYLEESGIQTRNLFAGNIIKHPCFDEMRASGHGYRVVGDLKNTDLIMNNSFWIGVYSGINEDNIEYMCNKIIEAMEK